MLAVGAVVITADDDEINVVWTMSLLVLIWISVGEASVEEEDLVIAILSLELSVYAVVKLLSDGTSVAAPLLLEITKPVAVTVGSLVEVPSISATFLVKDLVSVESLLNEAILVTMELLLDVMVDAGVLVNGLVKAEAESSV